MPAATARELMKRSKLSIDKIKTTDWRNTDLGNAVDVIVLGSIARGEGSRLSGEKLSDETGVIHQQVFIRPPVCPEGWSFSS